MLQLMDAPADAGAQIRNLASAATHSEKALLAQWAAYYGESELSLALLADAAPNLALPSVLWRPQMRDVRKLPAFKNVVRDLGLVEYWRAYGWPDFCQVLSGEEFTCR